jgi:hypothetical protein
MEDERSPQLPYLTQDLWTCDRKQEDLPVWLMEDDELKVTITPQFAGKVWAIYDKSRERDILFNNRAHQPANIAALKAWASGGAEWNWLFSQIKSHDFFTLSIGLQESLVIPSFLKLKLFWLRLTQKWALWLECTSMIATTVLFGKWT